jgi:plasmid stability protein
VRTTLTLDEDVAAKLKLKTRQTGRPFRDVVNDALRRGLVTAEPDRARPAFAVKTRDLGALRPGFNLDNIGDVIEQAEGPGHR